MAADRNPGLGRDLLSADLIAERSFSLVRRGFDRDEVSEFLRQVAGAVRTLHQQIDQLDEERRAAEERAGHPQLDEDVLMEMVGEETAGILRSARATATDIRSHASEEAGRLVEEARQSATALRTETEAAAARSTEEANRAAESIRNAAQASAEQMVERARHEIEVLRQMAEQERKLTVEGAQSVREKILADLTRRRRVATVQIEQLRAGRERLLESYSLVRRTLEEVQQDLQRADAEARGAAEHVGRLADGTEEPDVAPDLLALPDLEGPVRRPLSSAAPPPVPEAEAPVDPEAAAEVVPGAPPGGGSTTAEPGGDGAPLDVVDPLTEELGADEDVTGAADLPAAPAGALSGAEMTPVEGPTAAGRADEPEVAPVAPPPELTAGEVSAVPPEESDLATGTGTGPGLADDLAVPGVADDLAEPGPSEPPRPDETAGPDGAPGGSPSPEAEPGREDQAEDEPGVPLAVVEPVATDSQVGTRLDPAVTDPTALGSTADTDPSGGPRAVTGSTGGVPDDGPPAATEDAASSTDDPVGRQASDAGDERDSDSGPGSGGRPGRGDDRSRPTRPAPRRRRVRAAATAHSGDGPTPAAPTGLAEAREGAVRAETAAGPDLITAPEARAEPPVDDPAPTATSVGGSDDAPPHADDAPAPPSEEAAAPSAEEARPVSVNGAAADGAAETGDAAAPGASIEGLFARIKAGREQAVTEARSVLAEEAGVTAGDEASVEAIEPEPVERGAIEPEPAHQEPPAAGVAHEDGDSGVVRSEADEVRLERRQSAVDKVERTLTRKLKRTLQDEQNDLLDRLRNAKAEVDVTGLLGSPEEHRQRYVDAARPHLEQSLKAGSVFAVEVVKEQGQQASVPRRSAKIDDLAEEMAVSLTDHLRRRVTQAIGDTRGDDQSVLVEALGAAYRETKTQRVERGAGDQVTAAFGRGVWEAVGDQVPLRWVVEDLDGPCPDCDDNALAGALPRHEAFPTGQPYPPAHAGCRCLVVPDLS